MKKFIIFLIILMVVGFGIAIPTTIILVRNSNQSNNPTPTTPTTTIPVGTTSNTSSTTNNTPITSSTKPTETTTTVPVGNQVIYHCFLKDNYGNDLGHEKTVSFSEYAVINLWEDINFDLTPVEGEYRTYLLEVSGEKSNYHYCNDEIEIEEVEKGKEYNVTFTLLKDIVCTVYVDKEENKGSDAPEEFTITVKPYYEGVACYHKYYVDVLENEEGKSFKTSDYEYAFPSNYEISKIRTIPSPESYGKNEEGESAKRIITEGGKLQICEKYPSVSLTIKKKEIAESKDVIIVLDDYTELMTFRNPSTSYKAYKVTNEGGEEQVFSPSNSNLIKNNKIGFYLPLGEDSSLIKSIKLTKDSAEELEYTKLPKALYIYDNPEGNEEFYFEFEKQENDKKYKASATINLKKYFTNVEELKLTTSLSNLQVENPVVELDEESLIFTADSIFTLNDTINYKLELAEIDKEIYNLYFEEGKYYYVLDKDGLMTSANSLLEKNSDVLEINPICNVKISAFNSETGEFNEIGVFKTELHYNLEKKYKVNYIADYSFKFNNVVSNDSNYVAISNLNSLTNDELEALKEKTGIDLDSLKFSYYYYFKIDANSEFNKEIIKNAEFLVNDTIKPMQKYVLLDNEIYFFFLGNDMPYETSSSPDFMASSKKTLFTSSIKFTTCINGVNKTTTYNAFKNTTLNIDAPVRDIRYARLSPDAKYIYLSFDELAKYNDKYTVSGINLSITLNDDNEVALTNFNTKIVLTSTLMNQEKYNELSVLDKADYAGWYDNPDRILNDIDNYPNIDAYEGYYKYRIELSYQAQQAIKDAIENNTMKYRNNEDFLMFIGVNASILDIRLKDNETGLELSSQAGFGLPNETDSLIYIATIDYNME